MKTKSFFLLLFILFFNGESNAQESRKPFAAFRDSLDRAFDISNFLLDKKGFLIVPEIITEPAVGFGVAGAAIYFHSSIRGIIFLHPQKDFL